MLETKLEAVEFEGTGRNLFYYPLKSLDDYGFQVSDLPVSMRVVLESLCRNYDGKSVTQGDIEKFSKWSPGKIRTEEVPFYVGRVVMHDLGLGNLIDLATLREVASKRGMSEDAINPVIPVDVVIDHSVQVEYNGTPDAFRLNQQAEYSRNRERYEFIKWISGAFSNVRVLPPSFGIIHQINIEYLSTLVIERERNGRNYIFPDTVIGLDSHTPMVNGMGVLGWGVGGIEGMAAMLGEPLSLRIPEVVGVRVKGKLAPGIIATDIVLKVTELLRKRNMVGKFVEFFGESVSQLSVFDRATISNMSPEYGATVGLFPIDERTLEFMKVTGRSSDLISQVRNYYTKQGMFGNTVKESSFSEIIDLDLSGIEPSISGPNLPHRRIPIRKLPESFISNVSASGNSGGVASGNGTAQELIVPESDGAVKDGDIVIASITSCTNTSNPRGLIGAGILAKKAHEKGLKVGGNVKTSLSPGSRVVERYLLNSGLQAYLDDLGFNITGFGCMTCVGKGGPLRQDIDESISTKNLNVVAVTSSNRNFESRIHKLVKWNYITSPQMVVALALSGSVLKDPDHDPIGTVQDGKPVFLKEIWPEEEEIDAVMARYVTEDDFKEIYGDLGKFSGLWDDLDSQNGKLFQWMPESTYVRPSPFFENAKALDNSREIKIDHIRTLMVLGDNVSTDHISPESNIPPDSPAGKYLAGLGVETKNLDNFGSRRGNPDVKVRGAFSNNRLKNRLVDREGGFTKHFPDNETMTIFEAAEKYWKTKSPLVVFGGQSYGMGSSRDWAAKGTALLGIVAIVAKSFERIHRENLVCMGVLPLQFQDGDDYDSLGIDPEKEISITLPEGMSVGSLATMHYYDRDSNYREVDLKIRMDTNTEIDYYLSGGIMPYVLKNIVD